MKYKFFVPILFAVLVVSCDLVSKKSADVPPEKNQSAQDAGSGEIGKQSEEPREDIDRIVLDDKIENDSPISKNTSSPKNVRDYFLLLPEKYFSIECCQNDKNEYLKKYLTVEDTKNGYMEGGGDGAQGAFKIVLFKRPDKSYIIGFNSFGEMEDAYYFLEYKNNKWIEISTEVVPQFSKNNIYEFPRFGTTTEVFAKKVIDSDGEFEITEKGEKLYDLKWSDGKFTIQK